jgi:hypothetical protein
MNMKIAYVSPMGLEVSKGDWEEAQWTITGNASMKYTVRPFDSAYDFEEFIKPKVNCKGIEFDSEFCQFFAYAKTEKRAIKFLKEIEEYFERLRAMAGITL